MPSGGLQQAGADDDDVNFHELSVLFSLLFVLELCLFYFIYIFV